MPAVSSSKTFEILGKDADMGVRVLAPADQARQFVAVVPLLRRDQLFHFIGRKLPNIGQFGDFNLLIDRRKRNQNVLQSIDTDVCLISCSANGQIKKLIQKNLIPQQTNQVITNCESRCRAYGANTLIEQKI